LDWTGVARVSDGLENLTVTETISRQGGAYVIEGGPTGLEEDDWNEREAADSEMKRYTSQEDAMAAAVRSVAEISSTVAITLSSVDDHELAQLVRDAARSAGVDEVLVNRIEWVEAENAPVPVPREPLGASRLRL
jgi:hypothetical protein